MPDDNFYLLEKTVSQQPKVATEESLNESVFNNESRIKALFLTKKKKGKNAKPTLETQASESEEKELRFDLIPWNATVSYASPLSSLMFKESLSNGCMFGSILVTDGRNWIDEFQFTGEEQLELHFSIGKSDELIKLKFHIYDAKNISDEANNFEINSINERLSYWKLDFIGSEIFLPNYNLSPLDNQKDFVGLLSSNTTEETQSKSLVEYLFKKYSLPVGKIDSARTGVWLKYDHVSYPWMKQKGQLRISQLLKYLANYAWDGDYDHYHADYFFWQDRDGYNFRSLTKMLGEDENGFPISKLPDEGFVITIDLTNPNRIISTEVINEYNIQGLLENGSIFSYYNRVDPNYDNTYIDFLDSRESFVTKDLIYDYVKYREDIVQIENYSLLPDSFIGKTLTDSGTPNYMIRVDDEIYGYFNDNYLNSPYAQSWEQYGRTLGGPWASSNKSWQPQFDLTDLEYDKFKVIHLNIRESLKAKREEYARKRNIKRKWEVYRCTICCHENGALGSTADIALLMNASGQTGLTYALLFGPTGLYASTDDTYKVVAAGSFTDTLNYTKGNTYYERGLTYSYDLTKEPYSQSIGQFFNITGPEAPEAYVKFVIKRATQQYDILLNQIDSRISDLESFINQRVINYKLQAEQIFGTVQTETVGDPQRPIVAPEPRPIDLLLGIQNRFMGDAIIGESLTDWPITSYEFGMVPHSKVQPNKGVKQVRFGTDPTPQFRTLEFENPDGVNYRNTNCPGYNDLWCRCCVDGVVQYTKLCVPFDPAETLEQRLAEAQESCRNQDYCNCATATAVNPVSGIACTMFEDPDGDGNCSPVIPPGECEFGKILCCSGVGCNCVPVAECQARQGRQVTSCEECQSDNGNCPTGKVRCCIAGSYCTCVDPEICSEYGIQVTDCASQCQGDGNTTVIIIEGPPGPTGPAGPTGPTGPTGPSALPTEKDVIYIPECSFQDCSTDPVIRGYIKYTTKEAVQRYKETYVYAATYLWDSSPTSDWSYFDYGTDSGLIPGVIDPKIRTNTRNCLQSCGCYNTTCLSSVALEVLRRTCVAEVQLLKVERELILDLKNKVSQVYEEKWKNSYREWHMRNAFFFSKKPGTSIFRTETKPTVDSKLSLQNIKSITRKEVRGSRYELLANKVGITGTSAGQWLYNIFFAGNSGSTAHPYYDQKYGTDSYITSRKPHSWFGFTDADGTDDPLFFDGTGFDVPGSEIDSTPDFRGQEYIENAAIHIGSNDISDIRNRSLFNIEDYGYAQSDLSLPGGQASILSVEDLKKYRNTFNFFNTNNKKPPNIKKEEISSYIRVEFTTPIGLDTVRNFPNGFVRDAGVEYFLPYLVNLTVGPMGRQGVKYNVSVIGMDPYGFDVAVKKIKDDLPTNRKLQGIDKGNYYDWWNHDTGSVLSKTTYLTSDYNGMDLWPEDGFETEFPYYSYDPSQEDLHGGGFDMDFHMGGGYYFENSSQNWMESLYHYGVSNNKQFDPLYRTSVVGSYILPNSYRKLKPHRSWWSFFVPRSLFIPIRFANIFKSPNTKARDLFGGRGIFTISPNYWRTWYGSEFESWMKVSKSSLETLVQENADELNFLFDGDDDYAGQKAKTSISPHVPNSIQGYFTDSLLNYLAGNYILYRPNLVQTDLWKYDLSGETDYGLVTPPVDTEYDFFDRNIGIQFVVHSRGTRSCKDLGLSCANPSAIKDGLVLAADGCTASPYCNCPAQYLMPIEPEPTYLELEMLKHSMNECSLIQEYLGKDWLGCEFSDPNSTCSCNCPEQGKFFKNYLEYTRSYSTFWECPLDLPLRRKAQISQLQAQTIKVRINPNSNIKVGSIVEIYNANDIPDATKNKFKTMSGRWLVSEITHIMDSISYVMDLILIRNSLHYNPNESQSPKFIFTDKSESMQKDE